MNTEQIFKAYYGEDDTPLFTENIYGYSEKHITGDYYLLFEKSEGEGLYGTPLFGCATLIYEKNTHLVKKIGLSKAFYSKNEVEEYIESLDIQDVLKAGLYGKCIQLTHEIEDLDDNLIKIEL